MTHNRMEKSCNVYLKKKLNRKINTYAYSLCGIDWKMHVFHPLSTYYYPLSLSTFTFVFSLYKRINWMNCTLLTSILMKHTDNMRWVIKTIIMEETYPYFRWLRSDHYHYILNINRVIIDVTITDIVKSWYLLE